jgi:hypothetical protein
LQATLRQGLQDVKRVYKPERKRTVLNRCGTLHLLCFLLLLQQLCQLVLLAVWVQSCLLPQGSSSK